MSASTVSCDWLSAGALVSDIKHNKLNVTNIVAQCVNICDIAFESKRHEILGPGIIISTSILALLFSTFGMAFPILVWALSKSSSPRPTPALPLLRKLQEFSLKTSAFVILSFLITAYITTKQVSDLSILELTFVSSLVDFQLWCILGLILCQSSDQTLNQTRISWEVLSYYYVLFFVQIATSNATAISDKDIYSLLAKECQRQHGFVDVISSIGSIGGEHTLKWMSVGAGGGICFILLVIFGLEYVPTWILTPFKTLWRYFPVWFKDHLDMVSQIVMVVAYTSLIPANLIRLIKIRNAVFEMSSSQSMERSWGYGQTTAVLLWFPFVYYAVQETCNFVMDTPKAEGSEDGLEKPEKENILPGPYSYPPRELSPQSYECQHPASVSTATSTGDKQDLEIDCVGKISSAC